MLKVKDLVTFPNDVVKTLYYKLICGGYGGLDLAYLTRTLKANVLKKVTTCPITLFLVKTTPTKLFVCIVPFLVSAMTKDVLTFLLVSMFRGDKMVTRLFPASWSMATGFPGDCVQCVKSAALCHAEGYEVGLWSPRCSVGSFLVLRSLVRLH